jgi:hypothetical protein
MMLEHLVDDNHIDIDKEDLTFVQRLIKGDYPGPDHPKSKLLKSFCSSCSRYRETTSSLTLITKHILSGILLNY